LAQAEVLMKRYGHEGFPVVDKGELVGVLTRSEIDRALHHGLGEAPVSEYMHTGDVSVSPDDSVATLQRAMTDQGLGQVPVVQKGRVLGIVTRTDLIKLWSTGAPQPRQDGIQRLLRSSLPVPLLDLLLQARDTANQLGYSLYAVGGFVRDLLLGSPTLDIDLVVEGDAIALARRLAKQLRARVRSHGRFGTSKVILGGTAGTSLPPSLDFVTARTEFYQHPTALPEVERSSIKQDLYRRDFTINTMAICLDRDRYGQLIDFYGGERDLNDKLIRVLHNLSFVEDPTRILRAVRLEQRLGFDIESRTGELIHAALPLLDRVTGERLRHELELMLQEREPELIVKRLDELGVLGRLEPSLRYDAWLEGKLGAAMEGLRRQESQRRLGVSEEVSAISIPAPIDQKHLLLALLTYRMTKAQLDRFLTRLRFSQEVAKYLHEVRHLRGQAWRLDKPNLKPSRVYRMLHPFSPRALTAFSFAVDSPRMRDYVLLYLNRLRYVRLHVRGDFLKKEGLPQGPAYSEILDRLLYARLDGKLKTAAEEESLARKLTRVWTAKR
jgi:tRNA nucleotidyltransferase (CCA-adding enzyme)